MINRKVEYHSHVQVTMRKFNTQRWYMQARGCSELLPHKRLQPKHLYSTL